jgi:competence protein ComEC
MPLLWLSLAFLAGIILARAAALPALFWACLSGGLLLVWAVIRWFIRIPKIQPVVEHWKQRRSFQRLRQVLVKVPVPTALLLAALFAGAARYELAQPKFAPDALAWYNDREEISTLEGVLINPPDERDAYTNLRIAVDRLRLADGEAFIPVQGTLLARVPPGGEWQYGDLISLAGRLETPPAEEGFSYRDYLSRQGIYTIIQPVQVSPLSQNQGNPFKAVVYRLKEHLLKTVYRTFPDPEASLLAGILLGVESGIPQDVQAAFQATGTTHVIAISGFNIGIIAALFTAGFSRLVGRKWGVVAAILGIGLYTLLVGASASVLRAAVMGGFALIARQYGRQTGINTLAITAAIMVGENPNTLWDAGFQLSFAATLGLVLYATAMQSWAVNALTRRLPLEAARRVAGPLGEYFLFTLAAQVVTLPVIAYHFQRISLISVLTNPVVLPIQPPLMILGGLSVLLGMAWQPLGQVAAYLAWPFVAFTIRAVEWFAQLPHGNLALGSVSLVVVIAIFGLILALTVWRAQAGEKLRTLGPVAILGALGVVTVFVWRVVFSAPDGKLHVTILDVSAGSASGNGILIYTPSGRKLLIDGGPSATRLSDAIGRRLSPVSRGLDWLVVAAPEDAHLLSLPEVLDRFHPANVLWAGPTHETYGARSLQAALARAEISQVLVEPGQFLDLGEEAYLRALTVGQRGAVLLLEWNRFRLLLPVGMDVTDLEALEYGKTVGNVSALLLAGAGNAPLNPPEWIAALRPQVVLISVSAADNEGLPSPETLELLQGYTVLRTDRNGWIELSTDGENMWIEVERR